MLQSVAVPPGVGKTHLAVGLARQAATVGYRTYFTTAADLAARCHRAAIEGRWATAMPLEQHGGHSEQGVLVRVLQRLLALTAAIWHNHHSGQPVLRSLTAYDH